MRQPKLYILVGVPGSGKTTWVQQQTWTNDCVYISTDKIVEEYATSVGKTYSEVFEYYMPTAIEIMTQEVIKAREAGIDIVWDQTSTTVNSRAKKIRMLPNYQAIAVVMPTIEHSELYRRLTSRPGKIIPNAVVQQMQDQYQKPTKEEGFDTIIFVTNEGIV
jgi:predicted kinase